MDAARRWARQTGGPGLGYTRQLGVAGGGGESWYGVGN